MTDDTSDIDNNTFIGDKEAFSQTAAPTATNSPGSNFDWMTLFSIQMTRFAYNDSTVINSSGAAGTWQLFLSSFLSLSLSFYLSLSPYFQWPSQDDAFVGRHSPLSWRVRMRFAGHRFICLRARRAASGSDDLQARTHCQSPHVWPLAGGGGVCRSPIGNGSFSRCDNSGRQSRPRPLHPRTTDPLILTSRQAGGSVKTLSLPLRSRTLGDGGKKGRRRRSAMLWLIKQVNISGISHEKG